VVKVGEKVKAINIWGWSTTLPPSMQYDHSITLLPNAILVNYRPYRYSPEQKYDIER
jgi:hypothetical protein